MCSDGVIVVRKTKWKNDLGNYHYNPQQQQIVQLFCGSERILGVPKEQDSRAEPVVLPSSTNFPDLLGRTKGSLWSCWPV